MDNENFLWTMRDKFVNPVQYSRKTKKYYVIKNLKISTTIPRRNHGSFQITVSKQHRAVLLGHQHRKINLPLKSGKTMNNAVFRSK